jgi:response regulator RpfG family c-di-GMP phosphodiesterase
MFIKSYIRDAFLKSWQISPNQGMVGIVDDDSDIVMLFAEALCGIDGISVFTFNESLEALKHFTNNKEEYFLVICDLMMPRLNGLDLVKKIKQISPKTRTMITSCYEIEPGELQSCVNRGIIDKIIEKPISINTLRREVKNQINYLKSRLPVQM